MPKAAKTKKHASKKPNARLMAAIRESVEKGHTFKSYKTAKELFDEYR